MAARFIGGADTAIEIKDERVCHLGNLARMPAEDDPQQDF